MSNRHFIPTLPPKPSGGGRRRSIGASPSTTPSSPPSRKALGEGKGDPPEGGRDGFLTCVPKSYVLYVLVGPGYCLSDLRVFAAGGVGNCRRSFETFSVGSHSWGRFCNASMPLRTTAPRDVATTCDSSAGGQGKTVDCEDIRNDHLSRM